MDRQYLIINERCDGESIECFHDEFIYLVVKFLFNFD